jgi:hypothetical protein
MAYLTEKDNRKFMWPSHAFFAILEGKKELTWIRMGK